MYILIAVVLLVAAVVCFIFPDPLPAVEEIILVASSILTFVKGISDNKNNVSPEKYIQRTKSENEIGEDAGSVYVYKPPKKKSKTPKGYPKYDKNNPDAVYYYKK